MTLLTREAASQTASQMMLGIPVMRLMRLRLRTVGPGVNPDGPASRKDSRTFEILAPGRPVSRCRIRLYLLPVSI
jgi:hypothetical protein